MTRKILFLFSFLFAAQLSSQIVVNEFCVANYSDWDQGGDNEDWLELYNTSGTNVNIGGYWLSNSIDNPQKWQIPTGTTINANSHLIILLSGTGDYDPNQFGYLNTSFRVTQTNGEDVVFSNASGTVLESYDMATIGAFQGNHSYGRVTDGSANFAIFTNPTQNASNGGANYTGYASKPLISEQAGYKSAAINVSITAGAGETIYYTLDGTEPTNGSTPYTGPIAITTTNCLRAIAYSADAAILPSFIETNTYFFGNDNHQVMVVHISGASLSDGAWSGNEFTHIEFFTPGGNFITEATGDSNEHGNDSNAYPQRGFDYVTRDALGYANEVQHPVFSSSDRQGYERLIFKAAANDNYPSAGGAHIRDSYVHRLSEVGNLHLDERKVESCIVYINGQYWGVYDVREKVDDTDYTKFYYDQPDGFVDFIKTWGGTWNEYGSNADWNTLVGFITTNSMADPANYNYVLTQYNHLSLIDYFILNGYVVCTDWLNWNTAWWRGRNPNGDARRWRYALWDNDATFGHYVNYTGVPSTAPTADPCQIDGMGDVGGQGHIPVLNALFDNEEFFADYIQRYATLSNTIFSCDRMIEVLDSMIAVIEPEMPRQCTRWGGTVAEWQSNVQTMRDFILARCNDEVVSGIEDCYTVEAVNVTIEIDGDGQIEVEGLELTNATTPYTGVYFANLPLDLFTASDGLTCGNFAGWEITVGTGTIDDPNSDSTTVSFSTDITLVAHFVEPTGGPVSITYSTDLQDAGVISVNGNALSALPSEQSYPPGTPLTVSITENEWFVFDHWETNESVISPADDVLEITLSPCMEDSLTAIFEYIEHFTVDIQPGESGGGFVLFNGDTLPTSGITLDLEAANVYSLTAVPNDQWSTFSHWELDGNSITPNDLSATVLLELFENGSLTAVFTIIPHHSVTVVVEPAESGLVTFEEEYVSGNKYRTSNQLTVELQGDKPLLFEAIPNQFIDFGEWTTSQTAVGGIPTNDMVRFTFTSSDTIVAHFKPQPFAVYVPNSFSPNGDGLNDVFQIVGNALDVDLFELTIFDRWGQQVFYSTDPKEAWLGEFNDGQYYVGTSYYQYRLKVKSVFDVEAKELTGAIQIIR
ncbi:MAG: CotH kinase family protein [Flavobacteriales bacterium]|jgi:gliding motility-associated-like protein